MNATEESNHVEYTYSGVLNFLAKEFRYFQNERDSFELEKSQLKARIAELEGINKRHEKIQYDLLRRIKMLEFALRQERLRFEQLTSNKQTPTTIIQSSIQSTNFLTSEQIKQQMNKNDPILSPETLPKSIFTISSSDVLRKYLEDLSCSDVWNLISKTSNVPANAMNQFDRPIVHSIKTPRIKESPKRTLEKEIQEIKPEKLPKVDEVDDEKIEWNFDKKEDAPKDLQKDLEKDSQKKAEDAKDEMDDDEIAKKMSKELEKKFRIPKENLEKLMQRSKRLSLKHSLPRNFVSKESSLLEKEKSKSFEGLKMDDLSQMSLNENKPKEKSETLPGSVHKTWKPKYMLCSHLDSVRCVHFHSSLPLLVTASEDWTIKIWNLQKLKKSTETLPLHTYRGHLGPVLTTIIGEKLVFSAGADKNIRVWDIPELDKDPYYNHGIAIPYEKKVITGHDDAIWSLALHPNQNNLLSAAADEKINLWDITKSSPLVQTYKLEGQTPTCVKYANDTTKFIASFTDSSLVMFDIETGKTIWVSEKVESGDALVYQFAVHPTLPMAISAHEDKQLKFWDINSGKCTYRMIGHKDAISCVAIDPQGLYLMSGGHDSSLRIWDIESKQCVQEIPTHRKKYDESIHSVAYHPSKTFVASGGADSVVKIYQ